MMEKITIKDFRSPALQSTFWSEREWVVIEVTALNSMECGCQKMGELLRLYVVEPKVTIFMVF